MDPVVSLRLRDPDRIYQPGDELEGQYQIDAQTASEIVALEASVLWRTEGKGDEDMSVHFFVRRLVADAPDGDLRQPHDFRTQLPNSPLSYAGVITKIRWCARLRVFLRRGREVTVDVPFVLGNVPAAAKVEFPQAVLDSPRSNLKSEARKRERRTDATGSFEVG